MKKIKDLIIGIGMNLLVSLTSPRDEASHGVNSDGRNAGSFFNGNRLASLKSSLTNTLDGFKETFSDKTENAANLIKEKASERLKSKKGIRFYLNRLTDSIASSINNITARTSDTSPEQMPYRETVEVLVHNGDQFERSETGDLAAPGNVDPNSTPSYLNLSDDEIPGAFIQNVFFKNDHYDGFSRVFKFYTRTDYSAPHSAPVDRKLVTLGNRVNGRSMVSNLDLDQFLHLTNFARHAAEVSEDNADRSLNILLQSLSEGAESPLQSTIANDQVRFLDALNVIRSKMEVNHPDLCEHDCESREYQAIQRRYLSQYNSIREILGILKDNIENIQPEAAESYYNVLSRFSELTHGDLDAGMSEELEAAKERAWRLSDEYKNREIEVPVQGRDQESEITIIRPLKAMYAKATVAADNRFEIKRYGRERHYGPNRA